MMDQRPLLYLTSVNWMMMMMEEEYEILYI